MMERNVLITQVTSEEGRALAKVLRESGYYVYGTGTGEDFENCCDRYFRFEMNDFVSDAADRIDFTGQFEDYIPKLDVLIILNHITLEGSIETTNLENWTKMMNENITGTFLLIKTFAKRLQQTNGYIINVVIPGKNGRTSSVSDFTARIIIALSKTLASDFSGHIRVNSISGTLNFDNTELHSDPMKTDVKHEKGTFKERLTKLISQLLMPESSFISGANFQV
jgi:3-oxoacyl-[acyl-carrier protein] reductase